MSDKVRWKDVLMSMFKCCGKCHLHSKCSKCCELDIDPDPQLSRPNTPIMINENATILK